MQYWLMKCEPEVYSISDLERDKRTGWEGVRNYQARNTLRDSMKEGDLAFFYHSNAEPSGIAGLMKISKAGHPDPTQFDKKSDYFDPKAKKDAPTWFQVEVEFVEKFPAVLPLERLKKEKSLAKMVLLQKGSRLSVQPVSEAEWKVIAGIR